MIAMQYSFALPADYDMSIIDRRIRDNGHKLDGFPDLRFKAYLCARRNEMESSENLYAPFYLWERPQGMNAFLTGAGFEGVSSSFGWPSVRSWIVWHQNVSPDVVAAGFAVRHTTPIAPHSDLPTLRSGAILRAQESAKHGALASVTGFDPGGWTLVQFSLWSTSPPDLMPGQKYRVGHVSISLGQQSDEHRNRTDENRRRGGTRREALDRPPAGAG
jgi:hypothetical protein